MAEIFKAYDIRGVVPDDLDEGVAEAVGAAYAQLTGARQIVTVHDMRTSSVPLAAAFARGVTAQGAGVIAAGLWSTASPTPSRYTGTRLGRGGAKPVGQQTGRAELRQMVADGVPASVAAPGQVVDRDLLSGYAEHLKKLVDVSGIRPLKVVVDAGNGMGGHTVPTVFTGLPIDLVPMYFELDGTFPNHEANPIDPENLRDLQQKVTETGADLGLAFDGDADRCFVVDERGEIVSPSVLTALIAARELAGETGATAIFGGEHPGHFYFRDFWFADSGMLAALHVLAALGQQAGPLSALLARYARYTASGEINSDGADQAGITAQVRMAYATRPEVTSDELDGLTVQAPDWWFNLRPSNTEPLLRLNVEGADQATMESLRDEVLAMVRGAGREGVTT